MTRQLVAALGVSFALAVVASPPLVAHEGHDHKVMGTVKSIDAKRIEVEDGGGKTTWFSVTDDTKILRGQAVEELTGVRVGERVVVIGRTPKAGEAGATKGGATAQGETMIAKEIRLPAKGASDSGPSAVHG
ncbi:MAG: hypothetical protein ACRD2X_18205 [Vicinamibacteraceae bacterium]